VDTGFTKYFTTEFGAALAVMGIIVAVIFWRIGVPGQKQDATAQPETGAALQ
jgi:hypothetical protein